MLHGPLVRNILIFALPLMASNLLQIGLNAADTIVVGKFSGQQALAAVGATGAIINLVVSLFNGIAIGSNILIASLIGKGNRHLISDGVHTSYFIAIIGGFIHRLISSDFLLSICAFTLPVLFRY